MRNSADGGTHGNVTVERERLQALANTYGLAFVDQVQPESLEPALVADLAVEWARAHCLLPVNLGGEACVLTADPDDVGPLEHLGLLLGHDLRPVLAPRATILHAIEQCYYSRESSPDAFLRDLPATEANRPVGERSADLLQVAHEAPVTQLVNLILLQAVKRRASDIHIDPYADRLRIRYRVDGVLYEQSAPPKQMEDALVSRLKIMARMDIAERRLPQDGMARVRVGEREIDIRMSTIPVAEGERVVLRLLDSGASLPRLDAIGMRPAMREAFERELLRGEGMIVVCGPTGSGKTTTLYAALGRLDSSRRNILTIEDPIEYQLPSIGQMQVKPKIGLTFSAGLRHILRQDPDVILVGETRDLETAEIAVRSALTGHLVLTTLHTNDAAGAVLRLTDMGVPGHMLASCLRGALAQRLVRKLCPACRRATTMTMDTPGLPPEVKVRHLGKTIWEAGGCEQCLEGFRGRSGVFEWLPVDSGLRGLIRGVESVDVVRRAARDRGMVTLMEDALAGVLDGVTTVGELLAIT